MTEVERIRVRPIANELEDWDLARFREIPASTQWAIAQLVNTIASGGFLRGEEMIAEEDEVVISRSIDSFRLRVQEFLKHGEPTFHI
jgi:hypothetical protein